MKWRSKLHASGWGSQLLQTMDLAIGDACEFLSDRDGWTACRVTRRRLDRTYDVFAPATGERQHCVPRRRLRTAKQETEKPAKLAVGSRVRRGDDTGRVLNARRDGALDVAWKGGAVDVAVGAATLSPERREDDGGSGDDDDLSSSDGAGLDAGSRVSVRYAAGAEYAGTVVKAASRKRARAPVVAAGAAPGCRVRHRFRETQRAAVYDVRFDRAAVALRRELVRCAARDGGPPDARALYREVDADGAGFVDVSKLLGRLGARLSKKSRGDLEKLLDVDGDGRVDVDEFVDFVRLGVPSPKKDARDALHFPDHHEVRRRHPQGPLLEHRPLRRHDHVPGHRRAHDQGAHGPRALHDEDQGHRAPGAQVLRLDRRLHPLVPLHVPVDVDLQGRVRRVRPGHRPPQVLLSTRARGRGRVADAG